MNFVGFLKHEVRHTNLLLPDVIGYNSAISAAEKGGARPAKDIDSEDNLCSTVGWSVKEEIEAMLGLHYQDSLCSLPLLVRVMLS